MSTNIAAERGRALQTLYNDNPALSSCFIGGTPGAGIVAVNRCPAAEEGGEPEYAIWPQCVSDRRSLLQDPPHPRLSDCRAGLPSSSHATPS